VTFEQVIGGTPLVTLNRESLIYIILKSINLFHIFLQSRIYESEGFWKFVRIDLRRLLNMANNYKKFTMAYRLNNLKLQQIVNTQQIKKEMYKGVGELKYKLQVWQQMID
jgi:hypothetical protein